MHVSESPQEAPASSKQQRVGELHFLVQCMHPPEGEILVTLVERGCYEPGRWVLGGESHQGLL